MLRDILESLPLLVQFALHNPDSTSVLALLAKIHNKGDIIILLEANQPSNMSDLETAAITLKGEDEPCVHTFHTLLQKIVRLSNDSVPSMVPGRTQS